VLHESSSESNSLQYVDPVKTLSKPELVRSTGGEEVRVLNCSVMAREMFKFL
jgi:hypothetical protein